MYTPGCVCVYTSHLSLWASTLKMLLTSISSPDALPSISVWLCSTQGINKCGKVVFSFGMKQLAGSRFHVSCSPPSQDSNSTVTAPCVVHCERQDQVSQRPVGQESIRTTQKQNMFKTRLFSIETEAAFRQALKLLIFSTGAVCKNEKCQSESLLLTLVY